MCTRMARALRRAGRVVGGGLRRAAPQSSGRLVAAVEAAPPTTGWPCSGSTRRQNVGSTHRRAERLAVQRERTEAVLAAVEAVWHEPLSEPSLRSPAEADRWPRVGGR